MNYDDPSEGNKLSGLHRNFAREFRFQKVTNKKKTASLHYNFKGQYK